MPVILQRMKIKEINQCQSNDYFSNKIKELTHAVYFSSTTEKYGSVYNKNVGKCLDCEIHPGSDDVVLVYPCFGLENQYFVMTEDGRIKNRMSWFTVAPGTKYFRMSKDVKGDWLTGSQFRWRHLDSGAIQHIYTGKCLDIGDNEHVVFKDCDFTQPTQIWQWPKM